MTTSQSADEPRSMWRRVAAWVLVVLMGIAVAGSVVGFWVNRTVLETDRFMAVVTPIVESDSVQAVVSDRIADQLFEALDLETRLTDRLSEADDRLRERLGEALDLPDAIVRRLQNTRLGLESLAPMIAAGVETRIREAVTTFVSSPEGNRLLLRTIEVAHERSVLLLRDELDQLPNVVVAEGEVRVNFVPLIAEVLRSVVNAGLDFVGIQREIPPFDSAEDASAAIDRLASIVGRDLPPDFGQVRIASEESLEQAQGYVRAFDLALWALLIAAIVLGVLAVWLAPSIPVGAVRVGIAAAIAALAGWGLVQVLAARVADAATTADGRVAITEIVSSLVSGLNGSAFALGVIGIGVAASGFIVDRQNWQAIAAEGPAPEPPPPPPPAAPPKRTRRRTAAKPASSEAATDAAATSPPADAAEAPAVEAPEPEAPAEAPPKPPSTTRKRRRPPAAGALRGRIRSESSPARRGSHGR
jgi:hypothetical protein